MPGSTTATPTPTAAASTAPGTAPTSRPGVARSGRRSTPTATSRSSTRSEVAARALGVAARRRAPRGEPAEHQRDRGLDVRAAARLAEQAVGPGDPRSGRRVDERARGAEHVDLAHDVAAHAPRLED